MCVFDHLLTTFIHRYYFSLMELVVWLPGVASDQYMSHLQCTLRLQQPHRNPLSASANFCASLLARVHYGKVGIINLVIL
jgi:hypothetical protein